MKTITLSIIIAAFLIGGAMIFTWGKQNSNNTDLQAGNNVIMVDGKQVITINAKGGYFPRVTAAKADTPTVIKMNTQGTFDCSSAISIPSLGYRNNLPPSGETLIDVPPQKSGTVMRGLCAMGMYNFSINFD